MNFTKEELQAIVSMCRHETAFMRQIEEMVTGIKVSQHIVLLSIIASKADLLIEASMKETAKKEEPK